MPQHEEYEFTRVDDIAYVSIDPGTFYSGVVTMTVDLKIIHSQKILNKLAYLFLKKLLDKKKKVVIFIERITPQFKTGNSTIKTIFFCGFLSGALFEKNKGIIYFASRKDVKKTLLGKGRWKDKDVRAKLIERYGTDKIKSEKLYPTKKGSSFVSTDSWSALALIHACIDNENIISKEF